MVDTKRLHTLTPGESSVLIGVGSHSIRRWCDWHSAHLSPGANPGPGGQRRLTMRDVEVLKEVSNLRLQGLQTEQINEKLAQLTFAEIDTVDQAPVDVAPQSPLAVQEGQGNAPGLIVALQAMQTQIDALQQAVSEDRIAKSEDKHSRREPIYYIAAGFGLACLMFILLLLLFLVRQWL